MEYIHNLCNILKIIPRFKKFKRTCTCPNFKFTKQKKNKKTCTIIPISFDQKSYNAIDKNFNLQIKHFQYQLL